MCFEPTYKGLKLPAQAGNNLEGIGFEPTYKGLKRVDVPGKGPGLPPRFEPTYKGLKRMNVRVHYRGSIVLSLPIRD